MDATGVSPVREHIRTACAALFAPGQVTELRVLGVGGHERHSAGGWFDDLDALAQAAEAFDVRGAEGIYVVLNPLHAACLARAANKIKTAAQSKRTSSDRDVLQRHWLPIDLDPTRPAGVSSAIDELQVARDTAKGLVAWLEDELGFPPGIRGLSGNGVHLLYRVDLPNDDAARDLVKGCLAGLAARFDSPATKIDTTVHNASRIWKLYGTVARKGDHTAERPHRRSQLLHTAGRFPTFSDIAPVPAALLEELARLAPATKPTLRRPPARGSGKGAAGNAAGGILFDLDAFMSEHGIVPARTESWDGTGVRHILEHCLFDPSHTGTSAMLGRTPTLGIFYKCLHASCANRTWTDVRALYGIPVRPRRTRGGSGTPGAGDGDDAGEELPNVLLDTNEPRCVDEIIAALADNDGELYVRGGVLVRVRRDIKIDDGVTRPDGAPSINSVSAPNLRLRIGRCATFTKSVKQGDTFAEVPTTVAQQMVYMVHQAGEWPGIRPLYGVSDAPVLRPDGSVFTEPGYDARTGVLHTPSLTLPPIPDTLTQDDAMRAVETLLDVVSDFTFETDEHRSAWLAGLLTPLARFAFQGPSPLFMVDANVRGAGKGLLCQTIARIVLGRDMSVSTYTNDVDELRKKITSIAISGERVILLDNVEGVLGNDVLDRALTATRWRDRVLGQSNEVDLPLNTSWFATGNNISVGADTLRRVIHIRLDVREEHPEHRTGFKHEHLLEWIAEHRAELLQAALIILAGYLREGRPDQELTPFGSFEGWSSVVRSAVVWAGLPDPNATRVHLERVADVVGDSIRDFYSALAAFDPLRLGVIPAELIRTLWPSNSPAPGDSNSIALRTAIETLIGLPPGRLPTARQLGNRFRGLRGRIVDGLCIDTDPVRTGGGMKWRLVGTLPSSAQQTSATQETEDDTRDF